MNWIISSRYWFTASTVLQPSSSSVVKPSELLSLKPLNHCNERVSFSSKSYLFLLLLLPRTLSTIDSWRHDEKRARLSTLFQFWLWNEGHLRSCAGSKMCLRNSLLYGGHISIVTLSRNIQQCKASQSWKRYKSQNVQLLGFDGPQRKKKYENLGVRCSGHAGITRDITWSRFHKKCLQTVFTISHAT